MHHSFAGWNYVLLFLDLEHTGEYVGVVQLSAELSWMELVPKGTYTCSDTVKNIQREASTFSRYAQPEGDMEWD